MEALFRGNVSPRVQIAFGFTTVLMLNIVENILYLAYMIYVSCVDLVKLKLAYRNISQDVTFDV